jgi:5-methylcytosine-specific restriction endonuclease McrBC regulatory subunit McrC
MIGGSSEHLYALITFRKYLLRVILVIVLLHNELDEPWSRNSYCQRVLFANALLNKKLFANIFCLCLLTGLHPQHIAADQVKFMAEPEDGFLELLARILIQGTTHIPKQGLAWEYVEHAEIMGLLRGKLLLADSIRQ